MRRRYATAAEFRQALDDRIRTEAAKHGLPINDFRQKLVMERLLARLFATPDAPWLLKGGYAIDLRYRPRARTTRDLDFTAESNEFDLAARLDALRDQLQDSADIDPGDYFVFRIGAPRGEFPGPPLGGARFSVVAMLGGKEHARFQIDAGFGDAVIGKPETLVGEDFLDFAGLPAAQVVAISKAQHFAEKIHAYTYPWTDRENTRVKDLVDLVVLIERGKLVPDQVKQAVDATFVRRGTHPVPARLPDVPASWKREFASLADEAGLSSNDSNVAVSTVHAYWDSNVVGG